MCSEKRKLSNGAERQRWKGLSLGFCFSLFREHNIAGVNPVICVWDNLTLVAKKKWQWYLYWKLLWTACTWASRGMWCCLGLITLDHANHLILFYCLWRTFSMWNYLDHLPVYNFTVSHSPWATPVTPDCYCSVVKLCPTLCDPMDCSTPSFPVPHHLPEFAQVHVHQIGDATQPSHPLMPSSPPALNLWSIRVFSSESAVHIRWLKYWSFGLPASALLKSIQGWFPLGLTGLISLQSKGLSRVFSISAVWKHKFFSTQPSLWSSSHICTWLLERP